MSHLSVNPETKTKDSSHIDFNIGLCNIGFPASVHLDIGTANYRAASGAVTHRWLLCRELRTLLNNHITTLWWQFLHVNTLVVCSKTLSCSTKYRIPQVVSWITHSFCDFLCSVVPVCVRVDAIWKLVPSNQARLWTEFSFLRHNLWFSRGWGRFQHIPIRVVIFFSSPLQRFSN